MAIAIRRTGKRTWLTGEPPYQDGRQHDVERIACPIAPLPWPGRPWMAVNAVTAFTVARSVTPALAFFNVGVEIGQVVGVAVAPLLAIDRPPGGQHDPRLVRAASATAAPGVRRFVERTPANALDELYDNLIEVATLVLEDKDPGPETEFVGTRMVLV